MRKEPRKKSKRVAESDCSPLTLERATILGWIERSKCALERQNSLSPRLRLVTLGRM